MRHKAVKTAGVWFARWLAGAALFVFSSCAVFSSSAWGAEPPAAMQFQRDVQPILKQYCYDCHGDGQKEGDIAFDKLGSGDALLNHDLWLKVLKNTRAGIMPKDASRLPANDQKTLDQWIVSSAFGADPLNLDPGRVTVRRLNRTEYQNTIRDLMGVDFDTTSAFPADDVGYGFDTIGDVQSLSPMRMEKFIEAAQTIVNKAVPTKSRELPLQFATGKEFLTADGKMNGDPMTFYEKREVTHRFHATADGDYKFVLDAMVDGIAKPDPQRCIVTGTTDGKEFFQEEYQWYDCEFFTHEKKIHWEKGDHDVTFAIRPVKPELKQTTKMDYKILTVAITGPLDPKNWSNPPGYERFFTRDMPPQDPAQRRAYARECLNRFASKAFRRPANKEIVEQLAGIAEQTYNVAGNTFEMGVSRAIAAVLASPRFLFRVESTEPAAAGQPYANVDEYALASRLSYFLWSSMPDDELFKLAGEGKLRQNLGSELKRMLADPRSKAFIENFTGQWLNTREVLQTALNRQQILAREGINERGEVTTAQRQALKDEAEAYFGYVAHSDRSVLELLASDYTFLNETLANFYGIANVSGPEMRRVVLPQGDPRGGVLTMGGVLAVTSDPNRTSPVKRGKWILENILGSPSAPPPPDVPALDETLNKIQDHKPTQREALAIHRQAPLCASCHDRMDPLGLAFENFNALGMWRTTEQGQPVNATGKLMSGESFQDCRDLKKIIAAGHRSEFYHTLTEKLMTYALGRGVEYYDVATVNKICDRLEHEQGRFSALLFGIVESAPFQKCRLNPASTSPSSNPASKNPGAKTASLTPQARNLP